MKIMDILWLCFPADDRTLFVKGLADSVDEEKLQDFFSEASEVRLPQKEGYHRGYAFSLVTVFVELKVYLLEAYGPVNRTGSLQGFELGGTRCKET